MIKHKEVRTNKTANKRIKTEEKQCMVFASVLTKQNKEKKTDKNMSMNNGNEVSNLGTAMGLSISNQ
jgi:hypothetical protein